MQPAVYILASQRNGTLYIGVTSNLPQRVYQHREHLAQGFTNQHHVTMLVWYELYSTMEYAITREKQLKKWNRQWKLRLIEEKNPSCRIYGLRLLNNHHFHETCKLTLVSLKFRHSRAGGNPDS